MVSQEIIDGQTIFSTGCHVCNSNNDLNRLLWVRRSNLLHDSIQIILRSRVKMRFNFSNQSNTVVNSCIVDFVVLKILINILKNFIKNFRIANFLIKTFWRIFSFASEFIKRFLE